MWHKALKSLPTDAKMLLVGTCRGPEDEQIVEDLKLLTKELGISKSVDFRLNLDRNGLIEIFSKSKAAIHTMRDEHFGISVVELMAAGIVTIAHNSGNYP